MWRKGLGLLTKTFTHDPLDSISLSGLGRHAAADRNAETRSVVVAGQVNESEVGFVDTPPVVQYTDEFGRTEDTLRWPEPSRRSPVPRFDETAYSAASRARPRARRFLIMRRPFFVFMRARKPCLRARLSLPG